MLEKLLTVLDTCKHLLIFAHNNPDPDSLSSAMALQYLLKKKAGIKSTITYGGFIGREENKAMVKLLRINLDHISTLSISDYTHYALVDCQPGTGNNAFPKKIQPTIVIDHHLSKKKQPAQYADIRPRYGACATILTGYLQQAGLTPSPTLATALYYGIHSETLLLSRDAIDKDEAAYLHLFPLIDRKRLAKIILPPLPANYYFSLEKVINNAFIHKNLIISNLGTIYYPDLVAQMADLLVRLERVTWSLCFGIKNKIMYISLRTTHQRARADKLLKRIIGKLGTAGGHDSYAGGQIDLDKLDNKQLLRVPAEIYNRFLHLMGYKDKHTLKKFVDQKAEDKNKT